MSDAYYDDENFDDGFNDDTYHEGMNLDLWRRLLGYAFVYKREVSILAVCAVSTAICEIAFPLITRSVIDAVALHGTKIDLGYYARLYAGFTLLLGISVSGFIWNGGKLRTHVAHDIRRDGFSNLQKLSFSYYDFRPVGWLMARMTSDCERLSNILAWGMLDLIWGFTMMFGIAVAMLLMNLQLALLVLSILPVLAWMSAKFQRRILKSARVVRKTNSRITGSYNESIMGVQTSKTFVKEAENLKNFGKLTDQMHAASVRNAIQAAIYLPLVLTLGSLATGLALVFGGYELIGGVISAGTLIAFLTYTRHFFEPIEQLAHWFAELQMAQASAERVMSLVLADPDIKDSEDVSRRLAAEMNARANPNTPKKANIAGDDVQINEIKFDQVNFSYAVGDPVLEDINLCIRQGETLAIVGSTGGGKSTLVNLLCRFYEPSSGTISIDGIDYRDRGLHWLQSNLGLVLQSSHIFGGTIFENIRYGKLDAADHEIIEAAKRAGAHEFVQSLDDQYLTTVGEGGSKLSAGQKQLISFARAILADPRILILDEATSSVDTETEQQIQRGLSALLQGRIAVVIAHRLSTIRSADTIVVIEQGKIAEQGNHDALMAEQGRYYALYTGQSLAEFTPDLTLERAV